MINAPFSRVFRPPFGPGLAAAVSAVVTLILDNFTDANATSLDAHTIAPTNTPATSWTGRVGTWQIASNTAVMTSTTALGGATIEAGVADCTLKVTLTAIGDQASNNLARYQGVTARRSGNTNLWIIAYGNIATVIGIIERNSGSNTLRASAATALAAGGWISATLSGTTITALDSTGATCTYGSATLNSAVVQHGLANYAAASQLDDFTVTVP